MRRTLQRLPSLARAPSSSSTPFVCRQCQQQTWTSRALPTGRRTFANSPPRHALKLSDVRSSSKNTDLADTDSTKVEALDASRPTGQEPDPKQIDDMTDAELTDYAEKYEPAKTWDGLERLGGPSGWWEEAWDEENQFQGFIAPSRVTNDALESTVRRAVIEVLALQEAGRPMAEATGALQHTTFDYGQIGLENKDGRPFLKFEDEGLRAELLDSMAQSNDIEQEQMGKSGVEQDTLVDEDLTTAKTSSGEESVQPDGSSVKEGLKPEWYRISIEDLRLRFAILKRVMQLTGACIPDPQIGKMKTVGELITQLQQKPKATKLSDILLSKPELISLPNVEIYDFRRTPIDKEKEVGRWKIIERELIKRGLPVTGHN